MTEYIPGLSYVQHWRSVTQDWIKCHCIYTNTNVQTFIQIYCPFCIFFLLSTKDLTIYLAVFTNCGNLTKYSQLYDYSDKNIFSKYQCDCCKGFSTHHILLVMIEKKKTARDKKRILRGYSHRFIVYFFIFCFYFIINFMVWFAGFSFSGYLDIMVYRREL